MYEIDEIMELANLPSESIISDQQKCYDRINRFYREDEKLISPYEYVIESDGQRMKIRSIFGGVPNKPAKIKRIKNTGRAYSNYSEDYLEKLGFDTESNWNGQVVAARYNYNGVLQIAETDYYTTSLFSNILFLESSVNDNMTARKEFADDVEDFPDVPWFTTGCSIGGLIVNQHENGVKALLGLRSGSKTLNPNRYSIVPNAKMKPSNQSNTTRKAIQKVLREEVLGFDVEHDELLGGTVDYRNIMNGWNLRNTEFLIQYLLDVRSQRAYDEIKRLVEETDNEFSETVEVELSDVDDVTRVVNFEKMSPTVIPLVLESADLLLDDDERNYSVEQVNFSND